MTSKKNNKGRKTLPAQTADDEVQLAEEANASSLGTSRGSSPAISHHGTDTEEEEEPVNLGKIMKVLRGVGNEVKEFRKDTKAQLLDIRGELDKANARLNEMETRVAGHEDKLQNTDEIMAEMITTQEILQAKLTAMEAYSRRETIRVYGVPEGAESGSQSMIHFVEKLLRENLNKTVAGPPDPEGAQSVRSPPTKWIPAQIDPGQVPVLHS